MATLGGLFPGTFFHELGHIVAAHKLIRTGRVQINWLGLLLGSPFRGPASRPDVLPFLPWYVRLAGIVANAGVLMLSGYFLYENVGYRHVWEWIFLANLVIAFAEPILQGILHRGELYSFIYRYDPHFPELLSIDEGHKQLKKSAERYPLSKSPDRSSYVALVHLDAPFRQIASMRAGDALRTRAPADLFIPRPSSAR